MLLLAALPILAPIVHAETAIQAGQWEKTEKVTLNGRALPPRPQKICLEPGEASLERLLLITADEATARGCDRNVSATGPGQVKMSMTCPATDAEPAVSTTMDLKFTPTGYEGAGTVEVMSKEHEGKGTSQLSGQRLGDC
ncbi:MAG: DUF3617 family protein [Enhydrobacter sp.]|nr:DUF3617 family protein [Enhydrobacter sp.]